MFLLLDVVIAVDFEKIIGTISYGAQQLDYGVKQRKMLFRDAAKKNLLSGSHG